MFEIDAVSSAKDNAAEIIAVVVLHYEYTMGWHIFRSDRNLLRYLLSEVKQLSTEYRSKPIISTTSLTVSKGVAVKLVCLPFGDLRDAFALANRSNSMWLGGARDSSFFSLLHWKHDVPRIGMSLAKFTKRKGEQIEGLLPIFSGRRKNRETLRFFPFLFFLRLYSAFLLLRCVCVWCARYNAIPLVLMDRSRHAPIGSDRPCPRGLIVIHAFHARITKNISQSSSPTISAEDMDIESSEDKQPVEAKEATKPVRSSSSKKLSSVCEFHL